MHHSDSEDEGAPRVSYQVASALRQDALRPQAEQCRSSTKDHQHQPVQLIVSDDEADEPHIPFAQEPIPVQDTDGHQGAPKAAPAGFSSLFAGSSFKANASRAPAAKAHRSIPAARAKAKAGKAKALDVRSLTAKRPRQEAPASNPNAADAAGPSDPGTTPVRTMLAMFQSAPEASRAAAQKPRGAKTPLSTGPAEPRPRKVPLRARSTATATATAAHTPPLLPFSTPHPTRHVPTDPVQLLHQQQHTAIDSPSANPLSRLGLTPTAYVTPQPVAPPPRTAFRFAPPPPPGELHSPATLTNPAANTRGLPRPAAAATPQSFSHLFAGRAAAAATPVAGSAAAAAATAPTPMTVHQKHGRGRVVAVNVLDCGAPQRTPPPLHSSACCVTPCATDAAADPVTPRAVDPRGQLQDMQAAQETLLSALPKQVVTPPSTSPSKKTKISNDALSVRLAELKKRYARDQEEASAQPGVQALSESALLCVVTAAPVDEGHLTKVWCTVEQGWQVLKQRCHDVGAQAAQNNNLGDSVLCDSVLDVPRLDEEQMPVGASAIHLPPQLGRDGNATGGQDSLGAGTPGFSPPPGPHCSVPSSHISGAVSILQPASDVLPGFRGADTGPHTACVFLDKAAAAAAGVGEHIGNRFVVCRRWTAVRLPGFSCPIVLAYVLAAA